MTPSDASLLAGARTSSRAMTAGITLTGVISIDLTTEGLALSNCIGELVEFDDVAGRNAARCAVEEVAIDNGAQLRRRQRVISPHQILDFKSAVFANRLQRGDNMRDMAPVGEA